MNDFEAYALTLDLMAIRALATWLFGFIAVAVVTAFISANVRALAQRHGLDTFLIRWWDALPASFKWQSLRGLWWLWWIFGLSGGIVIASWLTPLQSTVEMAKLRTQLTIATQENETLTLENTNLRRKLEKPATSRIARCSPVNINGLMPEATHAIERSDVPKYLFPAEFWIYGNYEDSNSSEKCPYLSVLVRGMPSGGWKVISQDEVETNWEVRVDLTDSETGSTNVELYAVVSNTRDDFPTNVWFISPTGRYSQLSFLQVHRKELVRRQP
jgi:regulator of replication initiation timing